ncbi:hypothetical protein [Treponema sp.]|uniref:hypothetical protein n=1 Tax=Treponema sp. TaxID=166 RepID=UPI003FA1E42E
MKNNLVITDILLIESHFSLKRLPQADMFIYEIIDTGVEHTEEDSLVVIHTIQLRIEETDSKEPVAETFFKYGVNISNTGKYTEDEVKEFVINQMNQLYLSKANEFFSASSLPIAKAGDIIIKQ